jgi:hypothetical protein
MSNNKDDKKQYAKGTLSVRKICAGNTNREFTVDENGIIHTPAIKAARLEGNELIVPVGAGHYCFDGNTSIPTAVEAIDLWISTYCIASPPAVENFYIEQNDDKISLRWTEILSRVQIQTSLTPELLPIQHCYTIVFTCIDGDDKEKCNWTTEVPIGCSGIDVYYTKRPLEKVVDKEDKIVQIGNVLRCGRQYNVRVYSTNHNMPLSTHTYVDAIVTTQKSYRPSAYFGFDIQTGQRIPSEPFRLVVGDATEKGCVAEIQWKQPDSCVDNVSYTFQCLDNPNVKKRKTVPARDICKVLLATSARWNVTVECRNKKDTLDIVIYHQEFSTPVFKRWSEFSNDIIYNSLEKDMLEVYDVLNKCYVKMLPYGSYSGKTERFYHPTIGGEYGICCEWSIHDSDDYASVVLADKMDRVENKKRELFKVPVRRVNRRPPIISSVEIVGHKHEYSIIESLHCRNVELRVKCKNFMYVLDKQFLSVSCDCGTVVVSKWKYGFDCLILDIPLCCRYEVSLKNVGGSVTEYVYLLGVGASMPKGVQSSTPIELVTSAGVSPTQRALWSGTWFENPMMEDGKSTEPWWELFQLDSAVRECYNFRLNVRIEGGKLPTHLKRISLWIDHPLYRRWLPLGEVVPMRGEGYDLWIPGKVAVWCMVEAEGEAMFREPCIQYIYL